MRRWLALAALVGVSTMGASIFGAPTVRAAADGGRAPYDTIRDLRRLQDRIAAGDTIAEAAHAKEIERAAKMFAQAPSEVWADKRNARALIVYLFSGGSAADIEAAIAATDVQADLRTLYAGALAYGLGNDAEARSLLMPINANSMPNEVGGHLALVQATLSAQDDPAKAIVLLDLARLLEPGTLVEEAALRKEMSLIGATGDVDKFVLLSRRYLAAFSHSIYVENFRQLVAMTAAQVGTADTDEAAARLRKLLSGIDQDQQRRLYLLIARKAVIAGRFKMAALMSETAGRLSLGSHRDEARAITYFGAATIAGDRYDLGIKALSSVDPSALDPRDRDLRASALAVAELIRTPAAKDKAVDPHGDRQAMTMNEAERLLAAADELLKSPTL